MDVRLRIRSGSAGVDRIEIRLHHRKIIHTVNIMTEDRRLDEDAEGFEEHFDDADDEAFPYVQQYYASLSPNPGRGSGFFDARLANFHKGPNLPKDRHYFSVPKSLSHLKRDPSSTPRDHPLRAIAWVLHNAPQDSVVRVFCFSLTDPIAIDLLINAGFTREVKVILHPNEKSKRAMKEFVDQHGKNAFLENMEIRLANLSGSPCESRLVQMHVKSIITEDYTTYGSYYLCLGKSVVTVSHLAVKHLKYLNFL